MVRGERFIFLVLVGIFLLSLAVFAQTGTSEISFDQSKSYDWLYDKLTNSTPLPEARSLATIALVQSGIESGKLSGLVDNLKKLEDSQGCWPSGGCKVRDTALATLTLALAGQDVTKEVAWLQSTKVAGLPASGEWSIVVKSESDGTCKFAFAGGQERTFTIEGEKVKLPTNQYTAKQYYIRLNEIHPSLAGEKQPTINVQCELNNPIITLLYKPNENNFFIQRSDAGANLDLKVANVCFRTSASSGGCDYESTAYATLALLEVGLLTNNQELSLEEIGTHIYLESQAALTKDDDPVALGLLNRILIRASNAAPSFISNLVSMQKISDGSWDSDVRTTAIAAFGLFGSDKSEELLRAQEFLKKKVGSDGSWNGDVEKTAWALIALKGDLSRIFVPSSGGGGVEICGNGFDDDQDGLSDCAELECLSDPLCQCQNGLQDLTEDGIDCGGNCPSGCEVDLGGCTTDFDCDFGEKCENGICVEEVTTDTTDTTTTDTTTTTTPEEKSLWWLWLIVVLILLGLIFVFYTKFVKTGKIDLGKLFKKKPKGPTFDEYKRGAETRPMQRPSAPISRVQQRPQQRPTFRSKDDDELERSLKEAERLLKGK